MARGNRPAGTTVPDFECFPLGDPTDCLTAAGLCVTLFR